MARKSDFLNVKNYEASFEKIGFRKVFLKESTEVVIVPIKDIAPMWHNLRFWGQKRVKFSNVTNEDELHNMMFEENESKIDEIASNGYLSNKGTISIVSLNDFLEMADALIPYFNKTNGEQLFLSSKYTRYDNEYKYVLIDGGSLISALKSPKVKEKYPDVVDKYQNIRATMINMKTSEELCFVDYLEYFSIVMFAYNTGWDNNAKYAFVENMIDGVSNLVNEFKDKDERLCKLDKQETDRFVKIFIMSCMGNMLAEDFYDTCFERLNYPEYKDSITAKVIGTPLYKDADYFAWGRTTDFKLSGRYSAEVEERRDYIKRMVLKAKSLWDGTDYDFASGLLTVFKNKKTITVSPQENLILSILQSLFKLSKEEREEILPLLANEIKNWVTDASMANDEFKRCEKSLESIRTTYKNTKFELTEAKSMTESRRRILERNLRYCEAALKRAEKDYELSIKRTEKISKDVKKSVKSFLKEVVKGESNYEHKL